MQLKFISKDECHKMIDEFPGDGVYVITYDGRIGFSDSGKYIKKKKGKRMVDKSSTIVLQKNSLTSRLNLHTTLFTDFSNYNREDIIKSILLPRLE